MEVKTCRRCGIEKEITEFSYKKKAKGIREIYCRGCMRLMIKAHYESNLAYYLQKAVDRRNRLRRVNLERLLVYLAQHPCVDCGEADVLCLEFDHVRGEKFKPVSVMVRSYDWSAIEKEIEKCEVRCANCHRRKTARQGGFYRFNESFTRP